MSNKDDYTPQEAAERAGRVLERMLVTPHATQSPPKERKRGRPRKRVLKPRRPASSGA